MQRWVRGVCGASEREEVERKEGKKKKKKKKMAKIKKWSLQPLFLAFKIDMTVHTQVRATLCIPSSVSRYAVCPDLNLFSNVDPT